MIELTVNAAEKYPVIIDNSLDGFSAFTEYLKGDNVAIVTDENVGRLYGDCLDRFLTGKKVCKITVKSGEASKDAQTFLYILNRLASFGFTRSDGIIALGGGVIGDLAAFCASVYMRGINLVAVPTSLLAMVDSSVGGKTAINLETGKNLCGTFYQPKAVYVNTSFLKTLPERELSCGYGEIIKYFFLSDTVTEDDLKREPDQSLIYKCLKIKADIVAEDEKESGKRKLLNLGHTIGHAIERLSGFTLSHGECVAKGLLAALNISKKYYGLTDEVYRHAYAVISSKGHDLKNPFAAADIVNLIKSDKKSNSDGVDAVLIDASLKARVVHLNYRSLGEYLK